MALVSVIIPAYNAASTVAETLDSLLSQSFGDWEAIIVDDGSSDYTAKVVSGYTARDRRFRLLERRHAGVSAARNAGLAAASGELVLFLDADDLLRPAMLERTSRALQEQEQAVAAYSGWARLATDGSIVHHEFFRSCGDLFPILAGIQPFCIHCCLTRRRAVLEVGGFDPSLTTCEDWDLWQRLARTGRQLVTVPEVLVLYRMKATSASQDPHRMLRDGLRLVSQGHSPDPRVAVTPYEHGLPERSLRHHRYRLAAWSAGLALGQDQPVSGLLELAGNAPEPALAVNTVADALAQAVLLPGSRLPDAWPELWPGLELRIISFLDELEERSAAPDLARAVLRKLEAMVLDQVGCQPVSVGRSHGVIIDLLQPMRDIPAAADTEVLHCRVLLGGERLGTCQLPVFDGSVPAAVLRDAMAAEYTWPILHRYLRVVVEPQLSFEEMAGGVTVRRGRLCLAENLHGDHDEVWRELLATAGWILFLQEIWGRPEWPEQRFYDASAEETASTLPVHEGRCVLELSAELPSIEAAGDTSVEVVLTVGGVVIGEVPITPHSGRIGVARLRSELTRASGFELARVAVREALLGQPFTAETSLRDRLHAAATREQAGELTPGGWTLLARRCRADIDTSVSRHAALPVAALPELCRAARLAGEPLLEPDPCPGSGVRYATLILPAAPLSTEPPAELDPEAPPGPPAETRQLPILMYHQITRQDSPPASPFALSRNAFEEQLAVLRALGFRSISLARWRQAMATHTPVPGRAVILSFDDGTRDFADTAWPLLERYGFTANLFVVSEAAERGFYHDPLEHRRAPALSWDALRQLQREGVEIGSHTRSHRFLSRLAPTEIVRELAGSRAELEEQLGRPILSLAYPFGDESRLIRHLAGACGYRYGLSCRPGLSTLWEPLLTLPRIDAGSGISIAELAARLGLQHPEPVIRRQA